MNESYQQLYGIFIASSSVGINARVRSLKFTKHLSLFRICSLRQLLALINFFERDDSFFPQYCLTVLRIV